MRRTIALFGFALSILLVALFVGLRLPKPTPPPPSSSTPTPTEPVAPPAEPTPTAGAAPASSLTIGELVTMRASLGSAFVPAGGRQAVRLLIDLEAKDAPSRVRPPMAVALVIDRSGSMAGDKIMRARAAAKDLVSRLLDEDELALITYASDFSEDVPLVRIKGQRDRIGRAIDNILDGGGTNLSGGLVSAIKTLERDASHSSVRRVILLSDGNANQGVTDPGQIATTAEKARKDGITISTLGVGLDFNEDLMTLIAQSAGGGYYYARDAQAIGAAFETELQGLIRLAARHVEVGLEAFSRETIKTVYGYRTENQRGRLVIPIGDMSAGERRRVMVELEVDAGTAGVPSGVGLVLFYARPGSNDVREHRGMLRVIATADAQEIASGRNPAVDEAFEAALAAQARQDAASTFQSGNRAGAMVRLKTQLEATRRQQTALKSAKLGAQVVELEKALDDISQLEATSDEGRDLVKREKLRAREVFAY